MSRYGLVCRNVPQFVLVHAIIAQWFSMTVKCGARCSSGRSYLPVFMGYSGSSYYTCQSEVAPWWYHDSVQILPDSPVPELLATLPEQVR